MSAMADNLCFTANRSTLYRPEWVPFAHKISNAFRLLHDIINNPAITLEDGFISEVRDCLCGAMEDLNKQMYPTLPLNSNEENQQILWANRIMLTGLELAYKAIQDSNETHVVAEEPHAKRCLDDQKSRMQHIIDVYIPEGGCMLLCVRLKTILAIINRIR